MLPAKVERDEQQQGKDRRDDRRNAGPHDSERREPEFSECHRVAQRHVDDQAEHVADHDDVSAADAGEVRRDADLGKRDEHAGHQDQVVGALQFDLCRIVTHTLEDAGDQQRDECQERCTHRRHDDSLGSRPSDIARAARRRGTARKARFRRRTGRRKNRTRRTTPHRRRARPPCSPDRSAT